MPHKHTSSDYQRAWARSRIVSCAMEPAEKQLLRDEAGRLDTTISDIARTLLRTGLRGLTRKKKMMDKLTYYLAELTTLVRVVLGIVVLLYAAKVCFLLATMMVPPDWGVIHLSRTLPALGLIAVGTLLLDGRSAK